MRDQVVAMLAERGVTSADALLEPFGDDLNPVVATIRWFDDFSRTRDAGAGLLVKKLREGGLASYKSPAERGTARVVGVDDQLVARIRRTASCPMGFRRDDLESIWTKYAKQELGMGIAEFIDRVMGGWSETPPHPCMQPPSDWDFPVAPLELREARYTALVSGTVKQTPDLDCRRRHGESDWSFAQRFWSYVEPPEIAETAKRLHEIRTRAVEERRQARMDRLNELRAAVVEHQEHEAKAGPAGQTSAKDGTPAPPPQSRSVDDMSHMHRVIAQVRPYAGMAQPEEEEPW